MVGGEREIDRKREKERRGREIEKDRESEIGKERERDRERERERERKRRKVGWGQYTVYIDLIVIAIDNLALTSKQIDRYDMHF